MHVHVSKRSGLKKNESAVIEALPTKAQTGDQLKRLLSWASLVGIHVASTVSISRLGDGRGHGLIAEKNVANGDVLLSIPPQASQKS